MENMQVLLYPKEIHISTPSALSLRVTYKKMAISTNHELQKYQNRESYPIKNSVAVINDQVKFKLSKQFELNNTKVQIVHNHLIDSDISLDLSVLRQRVMKQGYSFKMKVDKCKDSKAYIVIDIKFAQKPVDINELKKSRKEKQLQKLPQLGLLKTDYFYKQQLYISRRQKQDKPTAYQISRKNYKNNQITRNNNTAINNNTSLSMLNKTVSKQKRLSNDSVNSKQNSNNGSYKKRFMYDVRRQEKTRERSQTKQLGSNYLRVYQNGNYNHKDKSPSPRMKTPQPITLDTITSKHQKNKYNNSRVQQLSLKLSGVETHKFDSSEFVDPDTFRAHPYTNQQYPSYTTERQFTNNTNNHHLEQQQANSHSNISVSSISSIHNEKDSKYRMITQKLQMIESKIRQQKEKYTDSNDDEKQRSKNNKLEKSSEVEEMDSYVIGDESRKYSPSIQRMTISKQKPITPFQDTEIGYQRKGQSPISPTDSTCPRNERAPSPIHQAQQTPQISKRQPQSVKMSEFTINSRKTQDVQFLQQQKSPQNNQQSISESQVTTTRTFQKINSPPIKIQEQRQAPFPTTIISPSSRMQSSREKRQIIPSGLSFQRRESQLKLQKKSSLGRNYIETQVKMMQLEIQQKDMKYERLQKKYIKKQEECGKLIIQNEQFQKKIMQLSNQLIEARSKVLQLERQSQQIELLSERLKQRQQQITRQREQIGKLTLQIQSINLITPQTKSNKQIPKVINTIDAYNQTGQDVVDLTSQSYQHTIKQKQTLISSLNEQLQTYQNEIACLRQRNEQFLQTKSKYNELNLKYQQSLTALQEMQKQKDFLINNKLPPSQQFKSSESFSPQNSSRHNLSPSQSSKSAHQLLQQTIQKQSLLQQSLKSLQSQNKTLAQNIKSLQQEKTTLIQKNTSYQNQIKILKQQQQLLQSNNQSIIRAKQTQFQLKIRQLQNERDLLSQKLSKKQKTIQKLSGINQSLNSRIFKLQQQNNSKLHEHNEETDILLLKNAQNEQLVNQLKQKLTSREKELNMLKQIFRDRQDEQSKEKQHKKQQKLMRRQPSSQSEKQIPKHVRFSDNLRLSKSDQIIKIKVTQEGKENFYQSFLNQKAKSTNLQAQLRYAQNDIRNLKMKIDLLTQEKKDLEQEIDMIAYNNKKDLAKKGLQHKLSMQNHSISESVKLQNKALKQQIKLLQSQVQDLNILLDSAIQRTNTFEASQIATILSHPEVQKNIMNEKYLAMARRLEAYEMQLRSKKNKMAEIVNAIWRGGNATLIDEIDKIMGSEE